LTYISILIIEGGRRWKHIRVEQNWRIMTIHF
jgi:hypothetical protein